MMRGNRADVATGSRPAVPASLTADTVKLEDFRVPTASESPVAQQSTEQLLKAQQLEIARLSDQLNLLAAKVDLLQPPAAPVALGMRAASPLVAAWPVRAFPSSTKPHFQSGNIASLQIAAPAQFIGNVAGDVAGPELICSARV